MATKKSAGAIVKWDEELAKHAAVAAGMEANTGGGQFFGLKGGILTWQDSPLPNNEMAVIILDHVFETTYYEGEYDPDNPVSPVAFAFGRDEKTLTWHETSDPKFAGKLCHESDVCQWGSADKGRGKAAKETRRLAIIPAGTLDDRGKFTPYKEGDHFETTPIGYMKLPVTSVKPFAAFVKQLAGALRRPPFGVFTKIKVVQDPNTQFKVTFEPISTVPDNLMSTVMARHNEAKEAIEFPYTMDDPGTKKAPARGKGKPAAKTTRGGRY